MEKIILQFLKNPISHFPFLLIPIGAAILLTIIAYFEKLNKYGNAHQPNIGTFKSGRRRFGSKHNDIYSFDAYKHGIQFEQEVVHCLRTNGFSHVLHNCIIQTTGGETGQIDVIVVHNKQVFIIECKNWSGTILGKWNWTRWLLVRGFEPHGSFNSTKTLSLEAKEIFSPVMQNSRHLSLTLTLLSNSFLDEVPVHSIIVFSNSSNITNIEPCGNHIITTIDSLPRIIRNIPPIANTSEVVEQNIINLFKGNGH